MRMCLDQGLLSLGTEQLEKKEAGRQAEGESRQEAGE